MGLISRKKTVFKISPILRKYVRKYGREENIPLDYSDLTEYTEHISLYDRNKKDTLWVTVVYDHRIAENIHDGLKKVYAILKAAGDISVIQHLTIDRIDLCMYANTQPFRIRVVNMLNENHDYFYVKRADSSRIYGLELEHLLSPNRIAYFVHGDTLVEEHIVGIPADQFLQYNLIDRHFEETRLAKEFVKFNERCFVRLLGDMHSSNFVIDVTPDFEETHYRMRAIDFDQQSYERRKSVYLPQFFKQNRHFVDLVRKNLTPESIFQYQREERALIFNRIRSSRYQLKALMDTMATEHLAPAAHVEALKKELSQHYGDEGFLKCTTMGQLIRSSLKTLIRKSRGMDHFINSKHTVIKDGKKN
ncbi:MAG TPA: hypothetical protein VNZ86_09740 [Bacteroidia bacterium]|jgi:hypothetical protein|nr:hypothetical protein [Bacteroidia bacterium]